MSSTNFSRYREIVDTVKSKNLAEYIGRDVNLERAGRLWRCKSPFRQDNDPSFYVYPDGHWHDYGTKESGDIISYAMKRDSSDFKTAITRLCRDFGIDPYWESAAPPPKEEQDEIDAEIRRMTERLAVFDILTEAVKYWWEHTPSRIQDEVFKKHYGFTQETIDRLQIGYAQEHDELFEYLTETKGYKLAMLVKTGLFGKTHDGVYYPFFRNRVIFPYWHRGRVVYLIGRQTQYTDTSHDSEKAKYKKLPVHSESNTQISQYIVNDLFYNEDVLATKPDWVVITEGVTDCISAMQIDVPCFSPVTIRFKHSDLPRLTESLKAAEVKQVYICNDADRIRDLANPDKVREPGLEGALDTGMHLWKSEFDVRICSLPRKASDPDAKVDLNSFITETKEEAGSLFEVIRTQARPVLEFMLDEIPRDLHGDTMEEKKEILERLKPFFEMLAHGSPVLHDHYIDLIHKRWKFRRQVLQSEVKSAIARYKKSLPPPEKKEEQAKKHVQGANWEIKGAVWEDVNHYYAVNRLGKDEIISNFTIVPKRIYYINKVAYLIADLVHENGETIKDHTFEPSAWISRRGFLSSLKNVKFTWTGSDDQVQGLARLLIRKNLPTVLTTDKIGYDDKDGVPKWVWKGGTIYNDRFLDNEKSTTVFHNTSNKMEEKFVYEDVPRDEVVKIASEALPLLPGLNNPEVIYPILGWCVASLFRPRLMKELHRFPILMVWGTKSSGKTSILRNVFWPLLGVKNTEPFSCDDTRFSLATKLGATSSCAIFTDEHKPRDLGKMKTDVLHRYIRRIYGGEVEQRGRADLSIQSLELSSPWMIAGESPPDDPATVDRLIQVCPSPVFLMRSEAARKAFERITSLDLHKLSTSLVQFTLGIKDLGPHLAEARKLCLQFYADHKLPEPDSRTIDNHVCVVFGLIVFGHWVDDLGVKLHDIDLRWMLRISGNHQLPENDDRSDVLTDFLESVASMAMTRVIKEGEVYSWIKRPDKKNYVYLYINSAYQAYCERQKRAGKEDDTGGYRALRRMIREKHMIGNSYVVDPEIRLTMDVDQNSSKTKVKANCVVLDPEKLPFSFPEESGYRSWGGDRG